MRCTTLKLVALELFSSPVAAAHLFALLTLRYMTSNQSMKPTAPLCCKSGVFATMPCRGLSPSR